MRIVIAADKFKGSLSAPEVADCLVEGLLLADPTLVVETVAVADGGEGTLDAAVEAGFVRHAFTVSGPTGLPVSAAVAVRHQQAVVEAAAAAGLAVLPNALPDATGATSFGVGQLIRAALDQGCTTIVIGVGGSACTDGGAGMLAALGARFLDSAGEVLPHGGGALARLAGIDLGSLDDRIAAVEFVLASDVDNPLLGEDGASAVFAPQKGADPEAVAELEAALTHYVRVLTGTVGQRAASAAAQEGAGAAGGIGYAALAILGARREPGAAFVQQLTGLAHRIAGADLVITGEGSLDEQTLRGKAPLGVAQSAAEWGIPVIAVCGTNALSRKQRGLAGFAATYSLTELEPDKTLCMSNARALLRQVGMRIGERARAKGFRMVNNKICITRRP
jgi:glycerate 2-kinase